jgi:ABC-type nitrate/sulfonate/bicarbonate transport system permease component
LRSIIRKVGPPAVAFGALLALWQGLCLSGLLPGFMLPSPGRVALAFVGDFPLLMSHLGVTLWEAACGLALSVAAAVALAVLMDNSGPLKRAVMPVLLLTQTIPAIAVAPLLVLWLGYGAAPKVALVFLTCFFPIAVGLLGGLAQTDPDAVRLLQSMGTNHRQVYRFLKLPTALPAFFSGLRISAAYSIVGAVVSEWLGGNAGLGVYMTRVRKSYSFDKMFAVILLTALLSLLLMGLVALLERVAMPYRNEKRGNS